MAEEKPPHNSKPAARGKQPTERKRMETVRKMRVGVIGTGAISDIYLQNMINRFEQLEVVSVAAKHRENARKKAVQYGLEDCTVEEMLADPRIEMVVILTPVGTHYNLIKAALLAGKHVYTEKTITDDLAKAEELLVLAEEKQLYLGSAPDTFLGAAWQTAKKVIDEGRLGEIHSFAITANRNNDVLQARFKFLREPKAGVLLDYAVYYMTALVSLLGPVEKVAGFVSTPYPTRTVILPDSPEYGHTISTPNESEVSAILRLKNGISGTFHIDTESNTYNESAFVIYGARGILYLPNSNEFGGSVKFAPDTMDWDKPAVMEDIPREFPYADNSRGIGPAEMAEAIWEKRKNRASKEMAYHVLEVLTAIQKSSENEVFCDIRFTL